ncbi:MAG: hypothetical protein IKC69_05680, partial [Clostridia bacterium]|nr:hypothetical protein [Clostridia bacterium]
MRIVYFDLSMDETLVGYRFAGLEGEHNATLLTALLPPRMQKGPEAEYRFLFETAKGEAVFSVPVTPNGEWEVSVPLARSLTVPPLLKAHVGCFIKEGEELVLVAKSAEMQLGIQKSVTEKGSPASLSGGSVPG